MRSTGKALSGLTVVLLGISGCWTAHSQLKPPPAKPEFVEPPRDDSRFSAPPEFPEKTLNQGIQKPDPTGFGPPGGLRAPSQRLGGAPGMGAGGY